MPVLIGVFTLHTDVRCIDIDNRGNPSPLPMHRCQCIEVSTVGLDIHVDLPYDDRRDSVTELNVNLQDVPTI